MVVFYNLLMLGVDAVAIVALWRATTLTRRLTTVTVAALVGLLLAAVAGGAPFGQMRLLACGLFIHGVIISLALAAVSVRGRRRWASAGWLAMALLLGGVGVDAFYIEPYWLEITRFSLRSPKIRRPIRVVAVADFQTDTIGDFERDVLQRVVAERPDLVLFVGDYIQVPHARWSQMAAEFRDLLRETNIVAPLGIYAVKGNIDPAQWTELFTDSAVQLFEETATVDIRTVGVGTVEIGTAEVGAAANGGLRLTGLSQPDSQNPSLHVASNEPFHIVFGHHPDYALGDIEADLMVAGHTHGGQVRLPLIGPLLTLSRVPRRWAAGITPRDNGRTLIVSRGTGLERGNAPRLRFLCRPELVVIELAPLE
jgi:uncharacterized protein